MKQWLAEVGVMERPAFDLAALFRVAPLAAQCTALVPRVTAELALVPSVERGGTLVERQVRPVVEQGLRVERQAFHEVQRVTGTTSLHDGFAYDLERVGSFAVPAAVGRWVSVATIKAMFDSSNETVLHRVGDRWRPVGDDHVIDLNDRLQEYLLGTMAFYS